MRRPRPRIHAFANPWLLALAAALIPAERARAQPAPFAICDDVRAAPRGAQELRAAALSESLFMATRVPEMEAVLGDALSRARARGDRAATLWFLRRAGELRARHGRVDDALPALGETERLALDLGDSLTLASAVRWQAAVAAQRGDFADARRRGTRLAEIAARTGDRVHGAWAESIGGWADVQRGDARAAIARYRRAAAAFRALGIAKDEIFVLNGLAIAQRGAGEYDAARASFLRTIALTESTIMRRAYGHALLQLAYLEHELGDPAAAAGYYEKVHALFRSRQAYNELADPLLALADAYSELGRFAAAHAALDSVRSVALRFGFREQGGIERITRARVELDAGRPRRAIALLDEAAALGDTLGVQSHSAIALVRAATLERLGRGNDAARVLEEAHRALGGRVPFEDRLEIQVRLADHALRLGNAAAALERATALALESSRSGLRELAMGAWLVAARAERSLGRPVPALAALDRGRAEWEALRGRPSAPEWRERRGALARGLIVETVDLLLAAGPGEPAARTRAAFDALQRYKARTLLERVTGPRSGSAADSSLAPATLDRVMPALMDGELMLDYLLGEDRAFVFAVTRSGARAAPLPRAAGLEERATLYRELLAGRRSGDAAARDALRTSSRGLGEDLMGPVLAELAAASRVLVSPDGALHMVPFSTLAPPDPRGPPAPLLDRASVATVPSASLLLAVRAAPRTGPPAPMLALADSLPGARSEARSIGAELANARFVSIERGHALSAAELGGFGAIHFAGHSEADDASPWRSPVPFLRLEDGQVASAADLAALRLPARLAVLSSCATIGGQALSGEGVAGLSSAFLAAGVPTVVASLWRVDDRATRRLMAAFYGALTSGEDAATALRSAQRAIRNEVGTSHPFYWAGFVVIGDGGADPGLRANPVSPRRLTVYAIGALALAAVLIAAQRFRRRKTDRPPL